jgi:EAL domain-containing protein (putative c-di-GMP-specific phosphodiesterase class I)
MAVTMGIGVIAEGVESEKQLRVADALGCGFAQGFHYSEPVPAAQVERVLAQVMPAVR